MNYNMKRLAITLIALMGLSLGVFAQESKKVNAAQGNTYTTAQGSYEPRFAVDGKSVKVKNVILMIGDGMGTGAVNAAHYANGGELTMTNLRAMGYVRTQSADNFTTDSAASGTAYACGQKTNNGYVGVSTKGEPMPNLPEKLGALGWVSGVVSTDDLNGATPASFFAHEQARGNSEAIWADLPESQLKFASAGARKVFEKQPLKTQEAISAKYKVVFSPEEVSASDQAVLYLPESVSYDQRGDYLPETTALAIEYLAAQKGKGFFLMVEGARIDKEAHSNNFPGVVKETLDFDKAIAEAIRFADKDGHTLVIISADHETGGLSFNAGVPEEGYTMGVFTSRGHTPSMVPLFIYGPHSGEFTGVHENSDISNMIYSILTGK